MSTTITPTEQNIEINVNNDVIDINVTNEIVDVNATTQQIDINVAGAYPIPNPVLSVFGRTGEVVATEGDYTLTQLGDVTLSSPSNGQVLKYNGTAWVNGTDAGGITTLNTLTALSQTFATGTSGTDFNISSATSTHTFNIPTASAINRGLLSSTDWTTFNSKQNALTNPITGTGTSGQVAFWNGTNTQTGSNNLFWDATNNRLGIGISSPTTTLDVNGTGRFQDNVNITKSVNGTTSLTLTNTNAGSTAAATFIASSNTTISTLFSTSSTFSNYGVYGASQGVVYSTQILSLASDNANGQIRFGIGIPPTERMRLFATGNLLIQSGGTFTDAGFRLDVNGTARVQGQLEVQSSNASQGILLKHSSATTATQIYYFPTDAVTYFDALFNYTASSVFGSYNFRSRDSSNALTSRLFIRGWDGSIGIGTTTPTSTLDVIGTGRFGPSPSQFGSLLSIRGNFNSLEFGTNNNAGFGSVLGTTNNSGRPFLAFNGSRGTVTNNTFLSSGIRSSILISDLLGGMIIGTVANANADNQSLINLVTITPTLTTILTQLNTTASITAASAIARGVFFNNTLVAAANNDVLVGLDINPTFTNGAFTGVENWASRIQRNKLLINATTDNNIFPLVIRQQNYSGLLVQNSFTGTNHNSSYNGFAFWINNDSATFKALINNWNSTGISIFNGTSTGSGVNIFGSTNNVGINQTSDAGFRLDVNGTARVVNTLRVGADGVAAGRIELSRAAASATGFMFMSGNSFVIENLSTIIEFRTNGSSAGAITSTGALVLGSSAANASSVLDLQSTTRGFLPPRMTTTQKNAISSPATGLQVYDTTLNQMSYYNGTTWTNI
jgi:hypothetical protein